MNHFSVLRLSTLLLLVFGLSTAMHAQLPQNNDTWKTRCNLLAASASAIQNGNAPSVLSAATRGVASRPYYVLAVNRAENDQHFVACTLYYMAAIAARQGNGGKSDPDAAADYAILAGAEWKDATGQSLTMSERMKRLKLKASGITGGSLTSTPTETSAVIAAATTMPLTLTPPVTTAHR
jgi:hypothetical protein